MQVKVASKQLAHGIAWTNPGDRVRFEPGTVDVDLLLHILA